MTVGPEDETGKASSLLAETTMPNPPRKDRYLPPEILDQITDLLHDEPEVLKQCCLVSKPWVPRTRKHLFADIRFRSPSDLESWEKTFPDATNSPAYYTRTLFVGYPRLITASGAEEGGWIRAFSRVTNLDVDNGDRYLRAVDVSLAPFHKFSPTLNSLRVGPALFPFLGIFDLVCSFPLLEDLNLAGHTDPWFNDEDPDAPQIVIPSTSPVFTGSLDLHVRGGAGRTARQLLELPNGLHFQRFALSWDHKTDLWWIAELVVRCSHSLETLDVTHTFRRTFIRIRVRADNSISFLVGSVPGSFNLSKATKLRDLVFRPESQSVEWITMALQTITPEHQDLRHISIYVPYYLTNSGPDIGELLGEATFREWLDLDRLLVQLWELYLIPPRVGYVGPEGKGQLTEYCMGLLLPEVAKRGIVVLV